VLRYLHKDEHALDGSISGVIIDGVNDYYTKDAGRRLAFAANMAGSVLPGKPLVEGTGSLRNFDVLAKNLKETNRGAYLKAAQQLTEKILGFQMEATPHPSVLVVHASIRKTSNSLLLWSKVAEHLEGLAEIEEISIRNGEVWDCRGCKYETCLHFGESSSCFYGGVMVEKVYPAIARGDILVLICPNYNDSVSANIMAFINRLTALFRTNDFSRKRFYALVVSGYSGSDIVAQQVIGAINMNKNFILPAKFALMATANNPGSVSEIDDIDEQAAEFAQRILLRD
jgi:multimeric flavodoxin WrbA